MKDTDEHREHKRRAQEIVVAVAGVQRTARPTFRLIESFDL